MFENTLIQSDQHWAVWAILISVAAFGLWAEKTRWGSRLSAVVVSILAAFILSNLSIIPSQAEGYDVVWSYLVPLAIPLLLFKADLRMIIKDAGPTLLAFIFGAIGTVLGTLLAFALIPLGEEGYKLAGIFCATYIGGSMNFVAASEALQLRSGDLLTAGFAADNLIMTVYFLLLFSLPSMALMKKLFRTKYDDQAQKHADDSGDAQPVSERPDLLDMARGLAIATVVCAVGFALSDLTGIRGSGILFVTAIIVGLATAFPKVMGSIHGADQIGTFLMQIFFAVIGASANVMIVIKVGPILFVFAAIILAIHLVFLLTAGKIFKLDLAEIVIASNANMGGPTTAAAMAVARKWQPLVIPAILCGTLGYAVATFIGVAIGLWLQ